MAFRILATRFLEAGNGMHAGPVLVARLGLADRLPDRAALASIAAALSELPLPPEPGKIGRDAMAGLIVDLASTLLWRAGQPDPFRLVRSHHPLEIAIACRTPTHGRRALKAARDLLSGWSAEAPPDRIGRLVDGIAFVHLFEEDVALASAAQRRRIHWRPSASGKKEVLLGEGRSMRRSISNLSDRTGQLGVAAASDKALANEALRRAGFPAARQRLVRSREDAVAAAAEVGYPAVVKPVAASRGTGVSCHLRNPAEVAAAFFRARRHGAVVVESLLPGDDHRLLVFGGTVVSCNRRRSAIVVGDGVRTVEQLVAAENERPERLPRPHSPLRPIVLDAESERVLESQSLTRRSILPAERAARMRATSNWSQGGNWELVTDRVHPENRRMAEAVARHFGLDIVGIDMITTDIGRPLRATGGAINEVQCQPSIRAIGHAGPDATTPHDTLLDHLFPPGSSRHIGIVAVIGTEAASVAERVADRLAGEGLSIGLGCTAGMRVDGRWLSRRRHDGRHGIGRLVDDPTLDVAIVEVAARDLLANGLGHRRLDVAVVVAPQAPAVMALLMRLADCGVVCGAGDRAAIDFAAAAGRRCIAVAGEGSRFLDDCARAAVALCVASGPRQA